MTDVKEHLESYEYAVQTLKRRWQDIRAIVEGGYAPSRECAEGFQKALGALDNAYSSIRSLAEKAAPEQSGEALSVTEYADLIEQRRQELQRREEDRKLLTAFVGVRAKSANYDHALEPYRREAVKLLAQPGDLPENALDGPRRFLACLSLDDPDSPEAEALMEALDEFYPSSAISRGLVLKKYILPENAPIIPTAVPDKSSASSVPVHTETGSADSAADSTSDSTETSPSAEPDGIAGAPAPDSTETGPSAEPDGIAGTPAPDSTETGPSAEPDEIADAPASDSTETGPSAEPDEIADASASDSTESASVTDEKTVDSAVPAPVRDKTKNISENNTPIPAKKGKKAKKEKIARAAVVDEPPVKSSHSSLMVPATKEIKYMIPNASAFKSDVQSVQGADVLLPLFTNLGALLAEQAVNFGVLMDHFDSGEKYLHASVRGSLDKLVNKNLLAAYDLDGDGLLIYCLTPYCYNCMQKNKIRNDRRLWAINLGKVHLCGTQQMEAATLKLFTAYNAALQLYLLWAKNTFSPRLFTRLRSAIAWKGSYYQLAVRWKEEILPCSLLLSLTEQPLPDGNILLAWEKIAGSTFTDVPLDISDKPPEVPPEVTPENGSVFCIRITELYRWNGVRWVSESDTEPDPPAPEKPNDDGPPDSPDSTEDSFVNGDTPSDSVDASENRSTSDDAVPADASVNHGGPDPVAAMPDNSGDDSVSLPLHSSLSEDAGPLISDLEDLSEYGVQDDMNARELARALLNAGLSPNHAQIYRSLVRRLISENRVTADGGMVENSIAQAIVLSKAMAIHHPDYQNDFMRLVLALDSRLEPHRYIGEQILTLFEDDDAGPPSLKLMTILRAIFAPDIPYDHTLRGYARSEYNNYEKRFPGLSFLKPLYGLLLELENHSPDGFSTQVLRTFSDKAMEQSLLQQMQADAEGYIQKYQVYSGLKAMTPMVLQCFGPGSDFRGCMEIIAGNRKNDRDLVLEIYSEFLDKNGSLSEEKIERFFDENWLVAIEKSRAPKDIKADQRAKVILHARGRLRLMEDWLKLTDSKSEGDANWLRMQRTEILNELNRAAPLLSGCSSYDQTILQNGLERLRKKLSGQLQEDPADFADFLRTGVFCLDEKGLPCLDGNYPVCRYYEPWRNTLLHISAGVEDLRSVLERISDPSDPLVYDNLGQAVGICKYLNSHCGEALPVEQYEADLDAIRRSAWEAIGKFMGELESAFAYGRLSELVKEDLRTAVYTVDQKPSNLLELFDERHNYGCLRAFLDALRKIIGEKTAERQKELQADIDDRKQSGPVPRLAAVLDAAEAKLAAPERNFVVAEEYINRFDAGITDEPGRADAVTSNTFLDFIGPTYDRLYTLCREHSSASLRGFGCDFADQELRRRDVSAQYRNNAQLLLRNMPNKPEDANPNAILALLKELGLDAVSAEPVRNTSSGMVRLSVTVRPDAKDKAEYAHPVDIMGTNMPSTLNVVCLFGRMQPNDIVDKICRLEMNRMALVFLNGPLDLQGRRQISERFHKEMSGLNPFLLIDWVLLLYLALRQKTERMPAMLSCTLPYTSSFQPFVESGSVSDEMFIGRKRELNKILDPNGPVIVYGGRQLGKTALLERAQSLAHHPGKREFAVLVRAGSMETPNEAALTASIVQELEMAGLKIPAVSSMQELCQNLRRAYTSGEWARLLLLIDESDKLLDNFRALTPAYRPVISLSDLTRATGNNFKFVFAGLHDVCAAANDPNTVFGQFGAPLIVKPLSAPEALELLSRPLRYLGFDIESARLEHLLVNTIFYPGIVHYVGYCLVQNLSTSYAKYYSAHDNPPYSLTDRQLGEIMSSSELNDRISKRIRWTLEVDPRYFMLARCVAYLYYEYPEQMKSGYSADLIHEYIALLEIHCLEHLDKPSLLTLLQELVDMGILVRPSESSFRLRQQRFLDIIGTSREKIDKDIQREQGGGSDE